MVNSLYEDSLQMTENDDPTLLCKTVGDPSNMNLKVLNFLFLGCEPQMPYGPVQHTGQLMMDLLSQALTESIESAKSPRRNEDDGGNATAASNDDDDTCWMLRMKLYNVQNGEYPTSAQEWDLYDGIILPGSFSAAYDDEPWIRTLCQVIQTEIVPKQRKTLGICFGHQVLAHSFADGLASKMPQGSRAGRYTLKTTAAGQTLLFKNRGEITDTSGSSGLDYFYSHGDQVERLPAQAVCLGGDDTAPILAAAYYGDTTGAAENNNQSPYALTLQAHPEYASSPDLGLHRTLGLILDLMARKNMITEASRVAQSDDSHASFDKVRRDSLDTVVTCGRLLGWFPSAKGDNDASSS